MATSQQVYIGDKESQDEKPDKCKFAVEAEFGGVVGGI